MGVAGKAFFLFLILLGIRLWIKKVLDIEKDNKKIETTLEIMNQSYTELQEQIDAARKYRHDIPKHLHIMEEVVLGLSDGKYCDDKLLNAIAHMKVEKCLEKNIDLKITFSMSEKNISTKLPIQEIDFNGLVQNLLDNAIEECCRIPESSERKIIWTIDQISEGIKIWVANSCNNTENIDFVTGKFGGTMVGDGVEIKGNINLAQQIPHYDLHLELYNVLPASLGIADIKDTVSITASVTGELPNPVIDGHLDFKELNIPGLHFSKVRGDLHYEDALLKFTNVKGNVFGGTVEAFGDYHLDTKYYNIDALGHELLGSIAARNGKIKCKVELDFKIRSKGDSKTALTYGSFKSGKGSYYIIPFDSISGEFSNQNKHLEFKNVVIETKMGTIKTDAFDIVNGKLHIGEIYLEEPENGQTIKII